MSVSSMRVWRLVAAAGLASLLVACAHPINIEPTRVPDRNEAQLVPKVAGYVITDGDRTRMVTTPGGGGDSVSYYPYRDLEKAIRGALRAVYQDVVSLRSPNDEAGIQSAGVSLVFAPTITTTSSSSSAFTWPPTQFSVVIQCTVTDPKGEVVAVVRADGSGAAEFSEFKSDFSLAGRRAVADAAERLVSEIRSARRLR